MGGAGKRLPPERLPEALAAIASWRRAPAAAVACPVCGAPGLAIVDRSARPHAEWYALSCATCGLSDTIHIPMRSGRGSID
ncbi:MAG: hypothetical protein KJZ80_00550 [Hyphomicrobiaceae bacterium]|nr:hypothetical protein [Hyphomicrobiaceae bacterium]